MKRDTSLRIGPVLALSAALLVIGAGWLTTAWARVTAAGNAAKPSTVIPISVNIDTSQDRAAISPYIYGSNEDIGLDLLTFRRLGGNRMTGYNWETNASNAGSDWVHSSDNFMCGRSGLTTAQCARPAA